MQQKSIFSKLDENSINLLINDLRNESNINYCNSWEHIGKILTSSCIKNNIYFGDDFLSTTIYGDSYIVKKSGNLRRDIAELYIVNKTINKMPEKFSSITTIVKRK